MKQRTLEFVVGLFVLAGLAAVLYLALQVGGARFLDRDAYTLRARFSNVSGLNEGSAVRIAGVRKGTVADIELNDRFYAIATLRLEGSLKLSDGTIASVKTSGLIGDKYVSLSPGGGGMPLKPGDMIIDTEPALDIEDLIRKFAFGDMGGQSEQGGSGK